MSRPKTPPPPIGFATAAMLAGCVPIPKPPKPMIMSMAALFGVGIDTRLAYVMVSEDIEDHWKFAEACKLAMRDNDTAFFQHAARITETLKTTSKLRLFVYQIGKVERAKRTLTSIQQTVNKWLVSDGKKAVGLDTIRNEMKALGLKYLASIN